MLREQYMKEKEPQEKYEKEYVQETKVEWVEWKKEAVCEEYKRAGESMVLELRLNPLKNLISAY